MLRMSTEAVFAGWTGGGHFFLFSFFTVCIFWFVLSWACIHALHLYQEKNYFWFLENLVVAMPRKLPLKGSTEFQALLLSLTPPQHLPSLYCVIFTSAWECSVDILKGAEHPWGGNWQLEGRGCAISSLEIAWVFLSQFQFSTFPWTESKSVRHWGCLVRARLGCTLMNSPLFPT